MGTFIKFKSWEKKGKKKNSPDDIQKFVNFESLKKKHPRIGRRYTNVFLAQTMEIFFIFRKESNSNPPLNLNPKPGVVNF